MTYKLQDLIDVTSIQDFLQCFHGVIKTEIAIIDKDTNILASMAECIATKLIKRSGFPWLSPGTLVSVLCY